MERTDREGMTTFLEEQEGSSNPQEFPHSIGLSGNQRSLDWQGQLDA